MGQWLTSKDLADFLEGKSSGVYVLWNGTEPIYEGMTASFQTRLYTHTLEKNFDNVQVIEISEPDQMRALETELIDILRPRLNKQIPSSEWDISWLTDKQPREPSQPVLEIHELLKPTKVPQRCPNGEIMDLILVYIETVGDLVAAEALGVPVSRIHSWVRFKAEPPVSVAQAVIDKVNRSEVKISVKDLVLKYIKKVGVEHAAGFFSTSARDVQGWVRGKSPTPLWAVQMLLDRAPKAKKQWADAVGNPVFSEEAIMPRPVQMTLFREVLA